MKVTDLPALPPLSEYAKIVGEERIEELKELAERLKGVKLQEINTTRFGGGVAEMLSSFVPFLRMLGLDEIWSIMEAEPAFFEATKTQHNFLQGEGGFSLHKAKVYWETNARNVHVIGDDRDVVVIHDPQPAGLVEFISHERRRKLIWRCHIHLESVSLPRIGEIREFIRPIIEKYDAVNYAKNLARKMLKDAWKETEKVLEESDAKKTLASFMEYLIERDV